MVQLAWVIGEADVDADVKIKSALIKPDDFQIASKAAAFHNIIQENALRNGKELVDVLRSSFPGLQITERGLSDDDIKGLWRGLDDDLSGEVTVQEFRYYCH